MSEQINPHGDKESPPGICPVSGLPILSKPEWTNVRCGENYEVTIRIVGDFIVWAQVSGTAGLLDVKESLRFTDKIVADNISETKGYVLIHDYSNFKKASREARKFFINYLKKRAQYNEKSPHLLGVVFCGVSPVIRISISLAKRLNVVAKPEAQVAHDYPEAIKLALRLLSTGESEKQDAFVETTSGSSAQLPKQGASAKIRTRPEWFFESKDFSLRFEVIGTKILHGITTGSLKEEHIAPAFRMQEAVMNSGGLVGGSYYYVLDLTRSEGTNRMTRKLYGDALLELYKKHPFRMIIFYGASRLLRGGINLARPFIPFKVRIVRDLDSALKLINEEESESTRPVPKAKVSGSESLSSEQTRKYVDELLHYLGSIDWETDGFGVRDEVDVSHPFSPVFDAIELIKGELDELLRERKQAEEERIELETRLQRAQKMEALGTLAGGVAHDLNNILGGLVSYPELLLFRLPEDSPLRNSILTIQKSGEKAAAVVQDLLTLARRGVVVTEVVNPNDVISEYLKSPEHEKLLFYHPGVHLETHLEKDVVNILGSSTHLSKTVMNLISNAAEAMPGGGKLIVSTENRYIDRPIRGYEDVKEGDYVVLTISDTGTGISPDDIEKIFEPFYTKKKMGRSGTGLGMAVVWGMVKDHNGYIDVQSTEGKGTTFTLYFPVTRKKLSEDKSDLVIEAFSGNGESILIVDDVEEQRQIASGMLKELGYSVVSVSSGEEAVEYLKTNKVDLLILDMIMDPGMDGLDTYKKILEMHPGQKAIIASGFSETDRVKEVQRLGAGAYIRKPLLLEKIGLVIKEELENSGF